EFALQDISGIKPGRLVAFGVFNAETGSEELVLVAEVDAAMPCDAQALRADLKRTVLQEAGVIVREVLLVAAGWLVKTTSGKLSREGNRQKYLAQGRAA